MGVARPANGKSKSANKLLLEAEARRTSAMASATTSTAAASASQEPQKGLFYRWLDEVAFPVASFPVCSLYAKPGAHDLEYLDTEKDTGCIIDSPWITMANPMIGFDVQAAADQVLAVAAMPAGVRGKPAIVVARGMGGGKTRVLESVRRLLLHRDGVMPLALTFNGHTDAFIDCWLEDAMRPKSFMSIEKACAVSVATRMASAVFGVEYDTLAHRINMDAQLLRHPDLCSVCPDDMIKDLLRFLVDRVNAARALQTTPPVTAIDTVVALLDESRRLADFTQSQGIGRLMHSAILDKPIAPGLKAALFVSDLGYLGDEMSKRKSKSNTPERDRIFLQLPNRLSPERVVSEWWGRDATGRELTDETRGVLELVAASLNNMPRVLEIADDFLRRDANARRPLDQALLRDLYAEVLQRGQDRYWPPSPSSQVLTAMYFRGEPIPVAGKETTSAFVRSVVTNSFQRQLVPDASLVLLRVCSLYSGARGLVKFIGEGIGSLFDCLTMTAPSDADAVGADKSCRSLGDVLEEAGLQALRGRLLLMRYVNADTGFEATTLARLCGIGPARVSDKNAYDAQRSSFALKVNAATAAFMFAPLGPWMYQGAVDRLSTSTSTSTSTSSRASTKKGKAAFLAELDALEVDERRPVRLVRPCEGKGDSGGRKADSSSWGLCIKTWDPATGGSFLVFFDDKTSVGEVGDGGKAFTANYAHTKAVLGPSRPFLYIYRSAHEDLPSRVLPAETPAEADLPSRCLVLGRADTLTLLGPFAEIYRVACAALAARPVDSTPRRKGGKERVEHGSGV